MEDEWIPVKSRKRCNKPKYKTQEHEQIEKTENKFDIITEKKIEGKKEEELIEKQPEVFIDNGENLYLNSSWSVWVHRTDCRSWLEDSYFNVYNIDNISTFWKFFNNFHLLNKYENQFFIMKDKIKPMWEDNANRNGAICSIKIDSKNNVLISEIIISISCLIMNETFLSQYPEIINGISIAYKNRSVLLKIWYNDKTKILSDYIPYPLIEKIENTIKSRKDDICISIQCKQIKPSEM
jgi:hypothetical protein